MNTHPGLAHQHDFVKQEDVPEREKTTT